MSYLVGPVNTVGAPFEYAVSEIPVERMVGERTCYAFGRRWMYTSLKIEPAEPFEAIIVWDPGWRTDGKHRGTKHEIHYLWELSRELDVPLIGVYSDWFATWEQPEVIGTPRSALYFDGIICDRAGAAALRAIPPMRVTDPTDCRYRPVIAVTNMLSFGRLPERGVNPELVHTPQRSVRDIDVSFVGNRHPQHVVLRPFYLEQAKALCHERSWTFQESYTISPKEMEELYLRSKVVVNHSLGSMLNMRVFEATACGAALVTDGHNIANHELGEAAVYYHDEVSLERHLTELVKNDALRARLVEAGTKFAYTHRPDAVWGRILDAVDEVVKMCHETWMLRKDAEVAV